MVVKLGATLNLSGVNEAREVLRAALVSGDPVVIDTAALTEIDFAGLQLLCATHRSAARQGRAVAFAGGQRGAVVDGAVAALGFGRSSGCGPGCLCVEAARG